MTSTLTAQPAGCADWTERVRAVARVAAEHAADVDQKSRFPEETIAEARTQGLLGGSISVEDGGLGATHAQLCEAGELIARECTSSAMILMMHYSQLVCLTRHVAGGALLDFRREVAEKQLLLASATTEKGNGGNTRRSSCHVAPEGGKIRLHKDCPVISYGRFADAIFVTARRSADAAESDQVLVVARASEMELERTSTWDTLGMRGTMSEGFDLEALVPEDMVFEDDFATISAQTMLPASHTLWTSAWYGLASAAGDVARTSAQKAARKTPGQLPPQALRIAELEIDLQRFHDTVTASVARFEDNWEDADALTAMKFAIAMDTLKVSASEMVRDICTRAMEIVGIAAFSNQSPVSLGRQVRDAQGPALMVANDRLLGTVSQLQMVARGSR